MVLTSVTTDELTGEVTLILLQKLYTNAVCGLSSLIAYIDNRRIRIRFIVTISYNNYKLVDYKILAIPINSCKVKNTAYYYIS